MSRGAKNACYVDVCLSFSLQMEISLVNNTWKCLITAKKPAKKPSPNISVYCEFEFYRFSEKQCLRDFRYGNLTVHCKFKFIIFWFLWIFTLFWTFCGFYQIPNAGMGRKFWKHTFPINLRVRIEFWPLQNSSYLV